MGTNECSSDPSDQQRVNDRNECLFATRGQDWNFYDVHLNSPDFPTGCIIVQNADGNSIFFNDDNSNGLHDAAGAICYKKFAATPPSPSSGASPMPSLSLSSRGAGTSTTTVTPTTTETTTTVRARETDMSLDGESNLSSAPRMLCM